VRDLHESIVRQRLGNQHLRRPKHSDPAAVVACLGAVQAQEFAAAKWGLGQRTKGVTDEAVARAFDEGRILRTHVMRPTWHFVAPADIRWLQALTAPRVNRASAFYYRQAGLDAAVFARTRRVIERALRDGTYLTRAEVGAALQRAGIAATGVRLGLVMLRAELDALVCSGPRRGKQSTYALLEERVPPTTPLGRDEALATLATRYFSSHGPATIRDFAWWSGLTVGEARIGVDAARPSLSRTLVDDMEYYYRSSGSAAAGASPMACLLPVYDEYLIAYKDREPVQGRTTGAAAVTAAHIFQHSVVIDGRLVGSWNRTPRPTAMHVEVAPFRSLTRTEQQALAKAAERYSAFLGVPVNLTVGAPARSPTKGRRE
jgi:hypothetical protein